MLKKLHIGPLTYQVIFEKDLRSDDGTPLYGDITMSKQVIRVEKNLTPDVQLVTLIHEILHGLSDMSNAELGDGAVESLAFNIVDTLRRNPELAKMFIS